MRRLLTFVYTGSGCLAAGFLVLTCGTVLVQVMFNLIGILADRLFGISVNWVFPSYADFAAYFFGASAFLGLGYAHHAGAHIRVSILLDRAGGVLRTLLEIWCLGVSGVLAGFMTFHAFSMVLSSYRYGDLSVGLVAVPLWIPQSAMALGALVTTIALVDDLVCLVAVRWRDFVLEAREGPSAAGSRGDELGTDVAAARRAGTSQRPRIFEPSAARSEMV